MTDSKQNIAAPAVRRRRLSAPERRRQIIAAAQEVFIRSSLSGARTREIAAEAGVNEATLFAHFESKEALFEAAVLEPLREAVNEQVEIARARAPQDQSARDASLHAHDRFLRTMLKSYPLLVTALFSDRAAGEEMYRKHIFPMIRTLSEITRERAGEDRLKHVDVDFMTLMGFGVHLMVVMDHHFRGTELDLEKTAAAITAMFDHGLRPD
jgi:AcrR family transcriptional regulator